MDIIKYIDKQFSDTSKIITRATEEVEFKFKTMTPALIEKVASYMPEINRATNAFGKTQSQYMDLVMTVSNHSPYRNLRQILAEVERRRQALKENTIRLKKSMIQEMEVKEQLANILQVDENKYKIARLQVKLEELQYGIADSRVYVEGALKTITSYMQAYRDIKTKFNIPDNWDEKDFELAEEEHHIKKAFEQAHADVLATGRITQGNHEYFRQCGINPQNALADLLTYMKMEDERMLELTKKGKSLNDLNIGIDTFVEFLNNMAKKYQGATRRILEHKGINQNGHYDDPLFMDKNIDL